MTTHYCNHGMNHPPILVIFTACNERLTFKTVGDGRTGPPDGWTSDWLSVTCSACLRVRHSCKRCAEPQENSMINAHADHYQREDLYP